MTDPDDERDPLDELAEEFLGRYRRGERPALSEYAARAPAEQAGEVRELLSALLMVEGLKPRTERTMDHGSRPGVMGVGPGRERLGDFRILREVGRGGMGVVYEAEQVSLGRRVALKVLSASTSRTSHQVQRFLREARSAAQLHHTNIVPVFGVGDQDGLYYYAMQFIVGQGLDKVLDEVKRIREGTASTAVGPETATRVGPPDPEVTAVSRLLASGRFDPDLPGPGIAGVPPARAVFLPGEPSLAMATDSEGRYARSVARVGVQVAEALEYAHHRGTLHRDIKPSNLLLDLKGNVWVADFGLAKAAEDDDLTKTGDLVGTLRYMAPERFRGLCDARSDIHALGLTLYELLVLRPAFEASGREGLIYQMTEKEPPKLRTINPAIPRDLETIVHKAIERDPVDRYPTAGAMAEDLRCFLEHRPIEARRIGSTERLTRWARRNPGLATLGTAVAGLLALTVLVIAAANLRLRGEQARTLANLRRAETAEADAVSELLESTLARARVGRVGGMAGRRYDGLRALAEAARRDAGGRRLVELRSEAIACLALADLRQARHRAGPPVDAGLGLDFDPALEQLARGTARGEILVEDPASGRILARLAGDGPPAVLLRFSPDGRFLAAKHAGRAGHVELAVYDVGRRVRTLSVPDGVYADAVDFGPDGRSVAAGRRDGSIVVYDPATGRQERRLPPGTVPQALRFDPSGRRIAVASPNSDLAAQVRGAADGAVLAEWRGPEGARALAWHPGGRWLAVGGLDGRVHLLDPSAPARPPRLLEGHDGSVVSLAAHPGGDLLASASWDGTLRIWDARTAREVVKAAMPDPRPLRFSGDGRSLGPGHDGASSWLWELADGGELRSLGDAEGPGATWSVDFLGRDGVLVSAGPTGFRLEAPGRPGVAAFAPMPGTRGVAAAPDGSFLITSGSAGLLRWPVSRPSAGELVVGPPAPVEAMEGLATGRLRLARDGRTLAVVEDDERGRAVLLDLEQPGRPIGLAVHPALERLDLSPDGRWAATGAARGAGVKVWDALRGALVADLPAKGGADVVFGPDGRLLATGDAAEYRLWEAGSWAPRGRFPRGQAGGQPGQAAFSPDGRLLAVARTRSLVQLIDPATGRDLATLEPPDPQHVSGLGFSPDGGLLMVASRAAAIRAWDLDAVRLGLAGAGLDWAEPPRRTGPRPSGAPLSIAIEPAPWLGPFQEGEQLARGGRWAEAASLYRAAIDAGAPGVDVRTRLAMSRLVLGDRAGYREACRRLVAEFGAREMTPKTANNIAWSCAFGPGALDDYGPAIALAEGAAASLPATNRLNTLGAALYRAGRHEEAIRQLDRAVEAHGAGGTPYDFLFFAMAHHRLGRAEEARAWLRRGSEPAPVAMVKPDAGEPSSWVPRVELDVLRREAAALIEPPGR